MAKHTEDRERLNHGDVKGHPSNQRQIWEQNTDIRNLGSEGILVNKPAVHTKERKKHITELELKTSSLNILLFNWLEEGTDMNWPKLGKPRSRWKNTDYQIPPSTHQILETLPRNLHFNRLPGDSVEQLYLSPWVYITKKMSDVKSHPGSVLPGPEGPTQNGGGASKKVGTVLRLHPGKKNSLKSPVQVSRIEYPDLSSGCTRYLALTFP